jgi:hypothetical protein
MISQYKLLVTIDQRAVRFNEPVTFRITPGNLGIDELAKLSNE